MNDNARQNVYKHRFDPAYLELLAEKLYLPNLIASAVYEPKEIKDVEYKRCIKIDFCGLAANTLLATNLDDVDPATVEARKKIYRRFLELFNRKNLVMLNRLKEKDRIYVKVRFCFSYLYSDYPICLMKAEQPEVWDNLTDNPVNSFYLNPPLSSGEFEGSSIHLSQKESLRKIYKIIAANKDLIILGGLEKKVNTVQVRFSPLPSPLCTLFINNEAFCDPYLYAKKKDKEQLSFKYPVHIFHAKRDRENFSEIQRHFHYLWRHDLTLFCGDATEFTPDNPAGLNTLRPPYDKQGNYIITWEHKIKRITEKQKEIAKKKKRKFKPDQEAIDRWKANVDRKLQLCTRKISEGFVPPKEKTGMQEQTEKTARKPSPVARVKQTATTMTIGLNGKNFYFKISFQNDIDECEFNEPKETLLYCVLAHYAFAKIKSTEERLLEPDLYKKSIYPKDKFMSQLILRLKSKLKNKSNPESLFAMLFDLSGQFSLKIPKANITFNTEDFTQVNKATYKNKYKIKAGCLDKFLTTS
jgi:hypothetical protein